MLCIHVDKNTRKILSWGLPLKNKDIQNIEVIQEVVDNIEDYKVDFNYNVIKKTPDEIKAEQDAKKNAEYNAWYKNAHLPRTDVERALYETKQMDFDDLLEFAKENVSDKIDIKKLKIELKANNFYRKHEFIAQMGELLGFLPEEIDYLFKNGHFPTGGNEELE